MGAITCPLIVPWLAQHVGWQGTFVVTGARGFIWVAAWAWLYRAPAAAPAMATTVAAEPVVSVPWLKLVRRKQTWAFVLGMMASAPVWWFCIFWIPDFLNKRFHLGLTQSSAPLVVIFLESGFGGILGGALPAALLRRGWTVNAARKTALLVCALAVLPVFATPLVSGVWGAVALVALAAAAHCGYAANLYTLVSDTVPAGAVASVVGIGGMAGSVAGMFFSQIVSRCCISRTTTTSCPSRCARRSTCWRSAGSTCCCPGWRRCRWTEFRHGRSVAGYRARVSSVMEPAKAVSALLPERQSVR